MGVPTRGSVAAADLAELLGVRVEEARALMRAAGVPLRHWAGRTFYCYDDLVASLPARDFARIRAAARERGFVLRSSGYTLAGYPTAIRLWDREKNGDLTPWHVSFGSNRRLWFKCPKGPDHQWSALAFTATRAQFGCPYCVNQRVSVTNSLATRFPRSLEEWHPTRNGDLTPSDVTHGSPRIVWWRCAAGHEWLAPVLRVKEALGCPYCTHRQPSQDYNAHRACPDLAREWHPSLNGALRLRDFVPGSMKAVWWRCQRNPSHVWRASVSNRVRGTSCPYCCGHAVDSSNSLAATFPEIAAQWHPNRNKGLTPHDVTCHSGVAVWWKCPAGPDHVWRTNVANRVHGTQCPMCIGRAVSTKNSLAVRAPAVAAMWHASLNGDRTPHDVSYGARTRVYLQCPKDPSHVWATQPRWMTRFKGGCPFCLGRLTCKNNSLAACRPAIARQWHPDKNGELTPHDVTVSSNRRVWWKCRECGAEWAGTVNNQTHLAGGKSGCATCRRRARELDTARTRPHGGA